MKKFTKEQIIIAIETLLIVVLVVVLLATKTSGSKNKNIIEPVTDDNIAVSTTVAPTKETDTKNKPSDDELIKIAFKAYQTLFDCPNKNEYTQAVKFTEGAKVITKEVMSPYVPSNFKAEWFYNTEKYNDSIKANDDVVFRKGQTAWNITDLEYGFVKWNGDRANVMIAITPYIYTSESKYANASQFWNVDLAYVNNAWKVCKINDTFNIIKNEGGLISDIEN